MIKSTPARQRRVLIQSAVALGLLAIFGVLRIFVFEVALITSASMEPTLRKGDYMLVNHASKGNWQRGEIILFQQPETWADDGKGTILVKRIIGLPGEYVKASMGKVSINEKLLDEPYLKNIEMPDDAMPIQLGPDEYYVLGDNRDNSDDSRINGPIREKDIQSHALALVFPFAGFKWFSLPTY